MRIVDLHTYRDGNYLYMGRHLRFHRELGEIKASPLANPFTLKNDGPVVNCLKLYREWLFQQIKKADPRIMALMDLIDDNSILACWCCDKTGEAIFNDPEVCHCQVIFKAWRYLQNQKAVA